MLGSIMVVGALTCCALSVYDLKATLMNVNCKLIQELMLYKFELWKQPKNFYSTKVEGAVDLTTVTRLFKKFLWSSKNLVNQARSVRFKTMDSEIIFQAIKANPESSTWRVSGELISQSCMFHHFDDLTKIIWSCRTMPLPHYKNIGNFSVTLVFSHRMSQPV